MLNSNPKILPQGYEVNFVCEVSAKYECPICFCVLKNPVQTPCGHRFCKYCIETFLRGGSNRCPNDNQKISLESLFLDLATEREILNLAVFCVYKNMGCTWANSLLRLEKHQQSCCYRPIKCPKCQLELQSTNLDEHIKKFCSHSVVECQQCKKEVKVEDLKNHQLECKEICKVTIKDDNGCIMAEESTVHCQMVQSKMDLEASNELLSRRVDSLQNQYCQMQSRFETKIDELHNVIKQLNENVAQYKSHQALLNCPVSASGDFIWNIRDFRQVLSDAKRNLCGTMFSQPFYTRMPGYKLCARVNLNGVDDHSRNYLSIYIHLMQGDYDDILRWPFNHRIVITIVDKNPDEIERKSIVATLEPNSSLVALQRPTEWKGPKGYGFAKFVSNTRLASRHYLDKDMLMIRIQVLL